MKIRCGKTYRTPLGEQRVCALWSRHEGECGPGPTLPKPYVHSPRNVIR